MVNISYIKAFFILYVVSFSFLYTNGGQELVHNFQLAPDDLRPHDIAIIQFDTRALSMSYKSKAASYSNNYWNVSARWNKAYAMQHGHQYAFISMDPSKPCVSIKGQELSSVWCKVKAMIEANDLLPKAKAFVYIDSDAVMTSNYSLSDVLGFMRRELRWDMAMQPIAFNQDGPGWSCKHTMKYSYPYCLNSGTLVWMRGEQSLRILRTWWESADDNYALSKFTSKWRVAWPWEQAQLYKVREQFRNNVMILSLPNEPYLKWTSNRNPNSQYPSDPVQPWCFSHWPGAYCFITHHCASTNQKGKLIENYDLPSQKLKITVLYI